MNASIKNIIFDFGGVILKIDYKLTENAFAKLGLKEFDNIYSQTTQKELFDVFEHDTLGKSRKSFAFHITYQSNERTLLAQEVDAIHERVRTLLKEKFHAEIRS